MKLQDRVAIVTGAGSGIGREIATLFASEGARIAAVDCNQDSVEGVAAMVAAAGGIARPFAVDVREAPAAADTVQQVLADWRRIDVLVTAAAVSVGGAITATPEKEWDRVFAVNVKGAYLWARAVLPSMIAARRGSIITVGSQLAKAGGRDNASYVASKGAISSLTRSIAIDYASFGIRANVLVPGAIETPMLERSFARHSDPAAAREGSLARHPLGRFGSVREIALGALYLASEESSFTTGSHLVIDGGWLAG